jgi:hypothetical protein
MPAQLAAFRALLNRSSSADLLLIFTMHSMFLTLTPCPRNAAGTADAALVLQNTSTALCNVGIMSW